MTIRKNTTETASSRGGYNYVELLSEWELIDRDDRFRENAACKGAPYETFFPETAANRVYKEAIAICAKCTVYKDCLRFAINNNIEFGVWGGMSPKQRRRTGAQVLASLEKKK
jgi:WhiB family redox-sensing transcriptional regulator